MDLEWWLKKVKNEEGVKRKNRLILITFSLRGWTKLIFCLDSGGDLVFEFFKEESKKGLDKNRGIAFNIMFV